MIAGDTDVVGGQTWTVRELFGRRFLVDSYQREYLWQTVHVLDLIHDLTQRFRASYEVGHEPRHVVSYEPYFLGPVITHKRDERTHLVDGQQRITTLMLVLIWLHRLQGDREDAVTGLDKLVVADHYGEPAYAVEDIIEPRAPILNALLHGLPVSTDERRSRSDQNLLRRYADIEELFPSDLRDDELPHFIYFLLERVSLVEITTTSDRLALETFETMNDRGLQLSPTDLLKSFILQQADPADHAAVIRSWRANVARLVDIDSNGDTAFIKSWLRAKYSRHATDDDAIGHGFNRWLRTNHEPVGLRYPGQFSSLVRDDMDRLSKWQVQLVAAAKRPTGGLDAVYYNNLNKITLQFPLILAAVRPDDTTATFIAKANMVAGYLDIVVARRMVNYVDFSYDRLSSGVFSLAREIRDMDLDSLARRLGESLAAVPETFDGAATYALRSGHRAHAKYLLSRLTAWLEVMAHPGPEPPALADVMHGLRAHEIEHVWANRPEYQPSVPARRFQAVRNQLGALVLLTKDINAAIGDDPFEEKVKHYLSNLLARSLSPSCYERNPRFLKVIEDYRLPFRGYAGSFEEAGVNERQKLYRLLCERVWDPAQYGIVVPANPDLRAKPAPRNHFGVTVGQLVRYGLVPSGARLVGAHRGSEYHAQLTEDGHFVVDSGETFASPSAAAAAVLDRPSAPGWTFWRITRPDGTSATLDSIRKTAIQQALLSAGP